MNNFYLLHGGGGPLYFNEIISKVLLERGLLNAKLVIVYNAKKQEEWMEKYERDKILISSSGISSNLILMGSQDISILEVQIKNADIVILKGGNTEVLKSVLLAIPDIKEILRDKIIMGTSAGANVICTHYFSSKMNTINQGLQIIHADIIVHDTDLAFNEYKKQSHKNHSLVRLKEGEFIIIDNTIHYGL